MSVPTYNSKLYLLWDFLDSFMSHVTDESSPALPRAVKSALSGIKDGELVNYMNFAEITRSGDTLLVTVLGFEKEHLSKWEISKTSVKQIGLMKFFTGRIYGLTKFKCEFEGCEKIATLHVFFFNPYLEKNEFLYQGNNRFNLDKSLTVLCDFHFSDIGEFETTESVARLMEKTGIEIGIKNVR